MSFELARNQFGRPVYEDEDILLYHGDAMEFLAGQREAFVDLAITSPPYNIGKSYESIRPLHEYLSWCEQWISLLYEKTKPKGAFWLNLGYLSVHRRAKAIPIPYLLWERVSFFLLQEIVWNYGAGIASKKLFSARNEKFLWYVKDEDNYTFNLDDVRDKNVKYPNQKKKGKLRCNTIGKNPSDVWQIAKVTSGTGRSSAERTPHPAQFPLDVIDRIILASSNRNDCVFDPFVGSGTSLISAAKNKRKAIGVEINKKYVDLSVSRIRAFRKDQHETGKQPSLFISEGFQRL